MKSQKSLIVIILFAISTSLINAQNPYISPGFRICHTFGEGLTIGVEISIGVFGEDTPYHLSVAAGNDWIISKKMNIVYVAGQGGYTFAGASIGKAFLFEENAKKSGFRYSVYGGLGFALLSYESMQFADDDKQFKTFGILGKLPIILKDEKLWWL